MLFNQRNRLYEMYVRHVYQSDLYGFIEVEGFIFDGRQTVVDPVEEKLKAEFRGVGRTYIPMYSILRIDEVEGGGKARIREVQDDGSANNIAQLFPMRPRQPKGTGSDSAE